MTSLAGVDAKGLRAAAFGATAAFSSSSSSAEVSGPAVSVESARLFTEAVSRVLHLHDDPRPFAALCLEFSEAEAASGGDGVVRESSEDQESRDRAIDRDDGGRATGGGANGCGGVSSPAAQACEGKIRAVCARSATN